MTRCEGTGRVDDGRLLGRRPGNGMRSAMLLSGLTTWLSVMTASRSASIVGSSASSPGVSRLRVSATSANCSSGPCLGGQLVDQPAFGQQPIGQAVLGQQPLDQTVLIEQLIDQAARLDGAHQAAVLLGQPVQHPARHGQLVHHAARLQQPVDRAARRQRPAQRLVLVHQPGQPVGPLNGLVDAEHVARPILVAPRVRLTQGRCANPNAPLATSRPVSATASPTRTGAVARSTRFLPRFMTLSLWAYAHAPEAWEDRTMNSQEVDSCPAASFPGNRGHWGDGDGCTTQRTFRRPKVLVVDDETNIVELLSVSLKFQGFEVHTASNGPAALDKAREVRPDAVILDVMMPGMDGFGLLRRLRADGIDSPALFLTARDTLQDKIAGLTLGGDDYVTKPFSLEEVVARLRVILRRSGRGVEEPRNARLTFADIELDEDTHEVWKAGRAGFAVADGVHAAAVLHHQRGHGAVQAQDPRPRVALRLRRRRQRRRVLRLLSAPQDRHRREAPAAHVAGRRLRPA